MLFNQIKYITIHQIKSKLLKMQLDVKLSIYLTYLLYNIITMLTFIEILVSVSRNISREIFSYRFIFIFFQQKFFSTRVF